MRRVLMRAHITIYPPPLNPLHILEHAKHTQHDTRPDLKPR